jgi:hypothetical protein
VIERTLQTSLDDQGFKCAPYFKWVYTIHFNDGRTQESTQENTPEALVQRQKMGDDRDDEEAVKTSLDRFAQQDRGAISRVAQIAIQMEREEHFLTRGEEDLSLETFSVRTLADLIGIQQSGGQRTSQEIERGRDIVETRARACAKNNRQRDRERGSAGGWEQAGQSDGGRQKQRRRNAAARQGTSRHAHLDRRERLQQAMGKAQGAGADEAKGEDEGADSGLQEHVSHLFQRKSKRRDQGTGQTQEAEKGSGSSSCSGEGNSSGGTSSSGSPCSRNRRVKPRRHHQTCSWLHKTATQQHHQHHQHHHHH